MSQGFLRKLSDWHRTLRHGHLRLCPTTSLFPTFPVAGSSPMHDHLPSRERGGRIRSRNNQECEISGLIITNGVKSHVYFIRGNERRCFSTTSDSNNLDSEKNASGNSNKFTENPVLEKISSFKPMDPDFEKYASGESHAERKQQSKIRPPIGIVNMQKETQVAKTQYAKVLLQRKEKARIRTAQTVHMALMGNVVICAAKLGAWLSSGSSGMLAEFIHSMVDCGNQGLLLLGLRESRLSADKAHPYGYGKSVYFWALVSALGTFFLGAGVSMTHAISDVLDPKLHEITWEVWSVLALSLGIDGYVLSKTVQEVRSTKPQNISLWEHFQRIRDPATLAILLEDGAACLGVVIAFSGILATHYSGNPVFDGIAGVGISALLGGMGIALASMNYRFLLGQGVDKEITDDIARILLTRRSIDSIGSVQSQWTGPETFSYKAEVDFDGTFIAAELMTVREYQKEFVKIKDTMDSELRTLLSLYAEDVMRCVEREVRGVEAQIRQKYPGAEYIELEPMSVDADRLAIDDNFEANLRRVERESLDGYMRSLEEEKAALYKQKQKEGSTDGSSTSTSNK